MSIFCFIYFQYFLSALLFNWHAIYDSPCSSDFAIQREAMRESSPDIEMFVVMFSS